MTDFHNSFTGTLSRKCAINLMAFFFLTHGVNDFILAVEWQNLCPCIKQMRTWCNLGPILPQFRDTAGFLLRIVTPPLFHPNFGVFPLGLDCQCYGSKEQKPWHKNFMYKDIMVIFYFMFYAIWDRDHIQEEASNLFIAVFTNKAVMFCSVVMRWSRSTKLLYVS